MGSGMSEEERRETTRDNLEKDVKKFRKCPDVTVNRAVVMFCSSSSSELLQQHLSDRKQRNYPAADWLKRLAEKLANLSPDPKLAGLGALAIAVFIDIISASSSSSETVKEALRCAFAEEKASEVWDHIDECLKRCTMHIDNTEELGPDIRRIEVQLSAAITKLKNSMVRDGHMTSGALKAWVNGAAFHIQMLIHLVRLGGTQSCDPVERLLSAYLSDLDLLFKKHRQAVEKKCRKGYSFDDSPWSAWPYFETEEGELRSTIPSVRFEKYFEAYYEEHYSRQKDEIRSYFMTVRDELPGLVSLVGRLSVQ
ncbi:uncharacterized protein [Pagrus major]|uniref:uncharacterized protein n=1 Tax=Pagrus major TaxID=143350 RepID=UPI003CC87611